MNNRPQKKPLITACCFIIIFICVSSLAVISLVHYEKQRDYNDWERFLNVSADQNIRDINTWINEQLAVVDLLAKNASLQHYTKESRRPGIDPEVKQSQLTYLKNLIQATALRNDFTSTDTQKKIKSDFTKSATKGLGIISRDFEIITGTNDLNFTPQIIQEQITDLSQLIKPVITFIRQDPGAHPTIGFLAPIISQTTAQNSRGKLLGIIYGHKTIAPLLSILNSHSSKYSSAESILLSVKNSSFTNISSLLDGTAPLKMISRVGESPFFDNCFANTETFSESADYRGKTVFFISKAIPQSPWILIEKIDTNQALIESRQHQRFLFISLGLATILIATLFGASWWYVSSIKKQAMANELRKQNSLLAAKNHLLDSINDNIKDHLLLVTIDQQCVFISTNFSKKLSLFPLDSEGRSLDSILNENSYFILNKNIQQALNKNQSHTSELVLTFDSAEYTFHGSFTPMHFYDPVGEFDSVLITLHDLTARKRAEIREKKLHEQLISSLMSAIDQHDPYSADHSAKTAAIAILVAKRMTLAPEEIETIYTAASLCNLGKLSIDKDILTKTTKLTDEELREIRLETKYTQERLKDIQFEGPVVETIVQKYEYLDGSGYPAGLQGDSILLSSRILAAVNAFIAMISPRAYRDRLSPQQSFNELKQKAESIYDPDVLDALLLVIENEIDWDTWTV